MNEHKVYDRVWIMYKNKPAEVIIYAVLEEMNHAKNGTEKRYLIVHSICGASEATATRLGYGEEPFKTRAELIASI